MKTILIISKTSTYCGVDEHIINLYNILNPYFKFIFLVKKDTPFSEIINHKIKTNEATYYLNNNYFKNYKLLKKVINTHKPDIIHIQTAKEYYFSYLAHLISKKNNALKPKIFITRHNGYKLSRFPNNVFLKHCDKILCVSNFVKQELIKTFPILNNKAGVIYNSIDIKSEIKLKISNNKKNNILNIGYMGRITKQKGLHILINALINLKNKYAFKLFIAGEFGGNNYKNYIMKIINKYNLNHDIHFLGFINDKNEFYSKIDFLVIPSLISCKEAFGLGVIESYKHKIPVITSSSGALKEIVLNGKTGFVYERDSPYSLSEKIEKMINSIINTPLKLEEFKENQFSELKNKYSNDIFRKEMLKVFEG